MIDQPASNGQEVFDYDLSVPRIRISDEAMLESLRRFADLNKGRPFQTEHYQQWSGRVANAATIQRRFGSWRAALARIGLYAKGRNYSADELVAILERVWRTTRRPPTKKSLECHGPISPQPYFRVWGTLVAARKAVSQFHKGLITREQLLTPPRVPKTRARISASLRWTILNRDNHRCVICGRSPATDPGVRLHLDHIDPVSKGGSNDERNLRTLCADCNVGRSNPV